VPENVIRERLYEIGYDIVSVGEAFKHVKKNKPDSAGFKWPDTSTIQKIFKKK
jgi:hypothetical protein